MQRPLTVIVLAAGQGTRMKSGRTKVLFDVCGRPALQHVLDVAAAIGTDETAVVVSPGNRDTIEAAVGDGRLRFITQDPPMGTGHAVRVACDELRPDGDVVVLYGDGPLYTEASLRAMLDRHRQTGVAETLLTARFADPTGYGRIVTEGDRVTRIVEELDADDEVRAIDEINTGILVFRSDPGLGALAAIGSDNVKGEYYLTDLTGLLVDGGHAVERVTIDDPLECASFNSIEELAEVRSLMRTRIVREHMAAGVDIVDPATTYIDTGVEIGAGTRILPCSVIAAGVKIGSGCSVGPFSHLREGAVLRDGAEVGNFTEMKKSVLGERSKAKHLTYLGNATIGADANIGCGTITANYDGKAKHDTRIAERAFIGSGTVLIAPCDVGAGATTGAGAVVKRGSNIEPGEVYVGVPARRLKRVAADEGGQR